MRTQILRAAIEASFALIAYCFMPDHLHVVSEGLAETSDLKQFVRRAKQYSGYHYSKRWNQRLWQRYSYERVLRESDDTRVFVRYVLENPVRAGLVSHPMEYAFIGSSLYSIAALLQFAYEDNAIKKSG